MLRCVHLQKKKQRKLLHQPSFWMGAGKERTKTDRAGALPVLLEPVLYATISLQCVSRTTTKRIIISSSSYTPNWVDKFMRTLCAHILRPPHDDRHSITIDYSIKLQTPTPNPTSRLRSPGIGRPRAEERCALQLPPVQRVAPTTRSRTFKAPACPPSPEAITTIITSGRRRRRPPPRGSKVARIQVFR